MRKAAPLLLLRLALLVAVFACAVLVVEYQNAGDPAFCGAGSGCMAVRRSVYSRIGAIPLPVLGLSAQAVLFALALLVREKSQTMFVAAAAAVGGFFGVVLIGIQALKIGAFCKWCLMVDLSAMVAAGSALVVHLQADTSAAYEAWLGALSRRRAQIVLWAAGAMLAVALPFVWGEYPVVPPLPPAIAAQAVPGKITMVGFTDFQCPYCRKLHPVIHELLESSGGRLVLVRKMMPLPGHAGAKPAALAYLCTPEAQRDAMADALYTVPEGELTRAGTLAQAGVLHLDLPAFERCLDAPATQEQLAAEQALFESVDAMALPYTYIGPRVVAGFNPMIARKIAGMALEGDRPSLPVAWMLVVFGILAAALIGATIKLMPKEGEAAVSPR